MEFFNYFPQNEIFFISPTAHCGRKFILMVLLSLALPPCANKDFNYLNRISHDSYFKFSQHKSLSCRWALLQRMSAGWRGSQCESRLLRWLANRLVSWHGQEASRFLCMGTILLQNWILIFDKSPHCIASHSHTILPRTYYSVLPIHLHYPSNSFSSFLGGRCYLTGKGRPDVVK